MQSSGHIISRIRCARFKVNSYMNYNERDRNYPNILIFQCISIVGEVKKKKKKARGFEPATI